MNSAIWLAGIFGPVLALFGFWIIVYQDNANKVATSLRNTPAAFLMGGILNLLLGLVILNEYNSFTPDRLIFVTIVGWGFFLRGLMVLFLPQLLIDYTLYPKGLKVVGFVQLILGLILSWIGYFSTTF